MSVERRGITGWFAQLWADIKAGTDPSLLGVVRFFGLLYGRIDRHLPIDEALKKALRYRLPAHVSWRHALGGITYLLFMVLVVTGVLLALYYRPSAQEAYPSIQHIVSDVSFGWLIRDLHVWSASLIVVAALAHMARVFFDAAYKPPRETNWLIGLLLLLVVLAFGATGYLLPWDQWAYWTVTEVLNALAKLPLVGSAMADLLTGDVIVSGATLSRYFALHVIILPWVALVLVGLHFAILRKQGVAPPKQELATSEPGVPFFPHHLLRSFSVAALVLAVTITVAILYPRPVGDPATPYQVPSELVSTWAPVDVTLALIRYLGPWGLAGFWLLGVGLAVLPLFDRRPERRVRRRPVVAILGVVFFVGLGSAWLVGRRVGSLPPTVTPELEALETTFPAAPRVTLPSVGPDSAEASTGGPP
jgi:quinol-cytochrome oxidoreductase complex cytochrome b subunit